MKTRTFWNMLVEKLSPWRLSTRKGGLQSRYRLSLIAGHQPLGLPNEAQPTPQIIGLPGLWLIPIVTTPGGLVVGALIYGFASEAEGHGTDTVVRAFHRDDGRITLQLEDEGVPKFSKPCERLAADLQMAVKSTVANTRNRQTVAAEYRAHTGKER